MITDSLVRRTATRFNSIPVGKFLLSIQASENHYCAPQEDGLSPSQYSEFEIAFLENGSSFDIRTDNRFSGIYDKLKTGQDVGFEDERIGYVPKALVDDIYRMLLKIGEEEESRKSWSGKSEPEIGDIAIYSIYEETRIGIISAVSGVEVFAGSEWFMKDQLLEVIPATKISIDIATGNI